MPRSELNGKCLRSRGDDGGKFLRTGKGQTLFMELFLLLVTIAASIALSLGLGAGLLTLLLRFIQTHSS
jgi:hypothetical protein